MKTASRSIRSLCLAGLFIIICLCWGHSIIIYSKASLAQVLIKQSWHKTLNGERQVKPWAWADTWPVAKLYIPSTGNTYYVLAGSHGSSLAFGPGHLDGSAKPGEHGTTVLSGHRDTHFSFLEHLAPLSIIKLQSQTGEWTHYRVAKSHIRSTQAGPWLIDKYADELHLVTCYPFNSPIPGGHLRHITIAEKIGSSLLEQPTQTKAILASEHMRFVEQTSHQLGRPQKEMSF